MSSSQLAPPAAPTARGTTAAGRIVVAALALVGLASLAVVLLASPEGIVLSSDTGAPAVPVWAVLLPPAAVIALALVLPRRTPPTAVSVADARRARVSTWLLVACAVAFTVIAGLPGIAGGELYILAKLVLLIALPAVAVALLRPAVAFDRGRTAWWVPVTLIVVWALLAKVAPWNPAQDYSGVDPVFLAVAALATALTAGVGEELFYRRWLQTRLEALLGARPGIALATLAFSLMHIGTHVGGDLLVGTATIIVAQGSAGLMLAILWWRLRLLWPLIVIHVLMNGWGIVPALLG